MTNDPILADPVGMVSHWRVGAVLDARVVTGGAVNDVTEIRTVSGHYFLRRYRNGSPALIEREHRAIAHVRRGGLPAVEPLAAADGSTFVENGGRSYALYPAAHGQQRKGRRLDRESAAAAGSMLGRLHRVVADLPGDDLPAPRIAWGRDAWLARLQKVEAAILASDGDEVALRRVRDQRAWLAHPDCAHADVPVGRQPIHGDYHQGNLFFGANGITGIIDWEQVASMPRAYEAVRAATYMFDLAAAPTRTFLQAWKEASGGTDEELDSGARTFGVVRDHWVWAVEEVYLLSNERARQYIPAAPFQPFARQWSGFLEKVGRARP